MTSVIRLDILSTNFKNKFYSEFFSIPCFLKMIHTVQADFYWLTKDFQSDWGRKWNRWFPIHSLKTAECFGSRSLSKTYLMNFEIVIFTQAFFLFIKGTNKPPRKASLPFTLQQIFDIRVFVNSIPFHD